MVTARIFHPAAECALAQENEMTTEESQTKPLVNCLQQELYEGKSGAPSASDTPASHSAEPVQPSGWWAFQFDPANPTQLTMLVTLTKEQTGSSSTQGQGDGCLNFYSSLLNVNEVQSLYQWLALQMSQQMAGSGQKAKARDTT